MPYYITSETIKDLVELNSLNKRAYVMTVDTERTRDSFLTALFLSKMSGKKKKNVYRKKRKGKPFTRVQTHEKSEENAAGVMIAITSRITS